MVLVYTDFVDDYWCTHRVVNSTGLGVVTLSKEENVKNRTPHSSRGALGRR